MGAAGAVAATALAPTSAAAEVVIGKGPAKGAYKVLDARCRPPINGYAGLYRASQKRVNPLNPHPGFRGSDSVQSSVDTPLFGTDEVLDKWMVELGKAGIDVALTNGRNQSTVSYLGSVTTAELLKLQNRFPGKCWGLADVNLEQDAKITADEVDQALRAGLRGANLEPGYRAAGGPTYVNDPVFFPIYEVLIAHDKPLQLQTGMLSGPNIGWSKAEHIDDVLIKFPKLKMILAHGGYPYLQETFGVAFKHRNLHVTPDTYMYAPGGRAAYEDAIRTLPEQLLFGTGYPSAWPKGMLEETIKLDVDKSVMKNYLHDNAARVLGL